MVVMALSVLLLVFFNTYGTLTTPLKLLAGLKRSVAVSATESAVPLVTVVNAPLPPNKYVSTPCPAEGAVLMVTASVPCGFGR